MATEESLVPTDPAGGDDREASLWGDAWDVLRRNPLFWISAVLMVLFVVMAAVPQLFAPNDPSAPGACDLNNARLGPSAQAWFGYDLQGCDVYALTIWGARSSILVGLFTTLVTVIIGVSLGVIAGYAGKWVDTLLSRVADVFFAIPLLLGGIIFMYTFPTPTNSGLSETALYFLIVFKVTLAMAILGWPGLFRLMRSSVMQVKPQEYIQASRALGGSPLRIIRRHIIPNAFAPVLVVATIDLGGYIATEATLSFLGIGLQDPAISWGIAISSASQLGYIVAAPHMLLFPSVFLSLTVLAFIMMGESLRDALDPKLR
ncbi:ABC transporter permease [Propionicicella superfundia]|uniref:ABC transporter permease n=1 Tax=Propionicicella superfundia TaxID=348582 RepID=UPI001FE23A5E|nr:ABC transporter permease [Propionicicella superfundia]